MAFFSAAFFLDFSRFSIEDLVGLVGFLRLGTSIAFFKRSKKRFTTRSLFLYWLRDSSHCKMIFPSLVNLDFNFSCNRCFSISERPSDAGILKVSSTLDETLFTCCPPAPLLRMALNCSSLCICFLSNLKTHIYGLQRYVKKKRGALFVFFP